MYTCMATKTISLDLEAYERLRSARNDERESFSKVVKRAVWPAKSGSAADLLRWRKELGCTVKDDVLDCLDDAQKMDEVASNKWKE